MRRVVLYPYPKPSGYYPVNLYNLLVYNKFGYVGNSASTKNVQLRRTSDNDIQDFLFDKNKQSSIDAVNAWRGGSDIRLVRRYNEGVGGAAYDLIQNTSGSQPFVNTTTWEVDFSGGNYVLESLENTSITDKNSIAIISYQTQATTEISAVFEEFKPQQAGNYNRFFSSTLSRNFYMYRPTGADFGIITPSPAPILTYRVASQRKVGDEVRAYLDNNLVDSVTSVTNFSGVNTSFREGFGIANLWFNGKSKGYIVHNTELTETILFELSTHLGD